MALFTVLRYGLIADMKVEREEYVEAASFLVIEGALHFFPMSLPLPSSRRLLTFAPGQWISVREVNAKRPE